MNITLRQLRIFSAVATRESITQAATALSLTQSAVSTAIRELEQQLGLQLFDRAGKRIRLNRQGEWLLPRAGRVLDQVQAIGDELGQAGRQSLAIGASTTIADCLFPRLAIWLYERHPDLELQLQTGNSSTIMTELLAHRIEFGLVEGVCQHPRLEITPWWSDQLVIVGRSGHPLIDATAPHPPEALAAYRWIMREAGSGTRGIFEHAFRDQLDRFEIMAELKHLPTIKRLVEESDALTCLSRISVAAEIEAGGLVVIDVAGMQLERSFYLLRHKDAWQSELHGELVTWLAGLADKA